MRTAARLRPDCRGFTLIEVMVALMVVAIGLAALMVSVSGTARTSGYLRDKTLAQWIALNRISEVRLNVSKFGQNTDTGEVNFGGRTWHYDTRYFDTSMATMKRVVVRVYPGPAKTKGSPLAESTSFMGTAIAPAGSSNIDWTSLTAGAPGGLPGAATLPGTTTTGAGSNILPGTSGPPGTPPGVSPSPTPPPTQ